MCATNSEGNGKQYKETESPNPWGNVTNRQRRETCTVITCVFNLNRNPLFCKHLNYNNYEFDQLNLSIHFSFTASISDFILKKTTLINHGNTTNPARTELACKVKTLKWKTTPRSVPPTRLMLKTQLPQKILISHLYFFMLKKYEEPTFALLPV